MLPVHRLEDPQGARYADAEAAEVGVVELARPTVDQEPVGRRRGWRGFPPVVALERSAWPRPNAV